MQVNQLVSETFLKSALKQNWSVMIALWTSAVCCWPWQRKYRLCGWWGTGRGASGGGERGDDGGRSCGRRNSGCGRGWGRLVGWRGDWGGNWRRHLHRNRRYSRYGLWQGRIKIVWGPWLKLRKGSLSLYVWKTEWTNWSTCIIETNEAWAKKRIIN